MKVKHNIKVDLSHVIGKKPEERKGFFSFFRRKKEQEEIDLENVTDSNILDVLLFIDTCQSNNNKKQ